MEKRIFNLFKMFTNGEISEDFFINELQQMIWDLRKELKTTDTIMFRFNDSTILYTYNEIVEDLKNKYHTNRAFLLESITDAVENNNIEIV